VGFQGRPSASATAMIMRSKGFQLADAVLDGDFSDAHGAQS
jgi:hypothetical protein